MESLAEAKREWEAKAIPYPLPYVDRRGRVFEEPFRKYGDAIAWLGWDDGDFCTIKKIETLRPRTGATGLLLDFLKKLATKHGIRIYGHPVVYPPTCPKAAESPLSQEALIAWYSKRGFKVGGLHEGVLHFWFPDSPKRN